MKKLFFVVTSLMMASFVVAQTQLCQGTVSDAQTGETLIGVSVIEANTTNGVVTDFDGNFSFEVSPGATIQFSYVGYTTLNVDTRKGAKLGMVKLEPETVTLQDVTVVGQIARQQQTPVAVSQVTALEIEERLGSAEFPEVLKNTPGVHSNGNGGGWGDAEIWMRGFDNTNVATMVNGVPMNDMENGSVYWSNWQGLSDVTSVMQTQRGMGASKLSAPSVGGTINIITKGIDAKRGGNISYALGNDGYNKIGFTISTGLMKSGWALTLMGTKTWGDGYVQGTSFSGYSYFANLAYRVNENHQLSLTVFGAPQGHYQRPSGSNGALTLDEWHRVARYMDGDKDFRRYNPAYGYDNYGNHKSANYNNYHKPQISLNHVWQIDHTSSLSSTVYVSIGRGYGYTGEAGAKSSYSYSDLTKGANNGVITTTFRREDGTFDFGAIQDLNAASEYGSELVIAKNRNNHNWVGLVSTYDKKFIECLELTAGIDVRYYQGIHTAEICDLLNGAYFLDGSRANALLANNRHRNDPSWLNEKLGIGDIVYRDYTGHVMQEGFFASLEYSKNALSAFINGSFSYNHNWRIDRFYYDEDHRKSETVGFAGGTIKGGVNYKFGHYNNVFVNAGFISRAPKFTGIFMSATTSHAVNKDAKSEKVASVEVGYGFQNEFINLALNGYFTEWMDKTMTKSSTLNDVNQTSYYMNMTGVSARHMGIEFDFRARPAKWVEMNAMFSLGDWKWDKDGVKGYAYDENGNALRTDGTFTTPGAEDHASAIINMKGIRVGGQAQTTANVGITFKPFKGFRIGGEYTWYARNYSYYSLSGSNLSLGKEVNVIAPYKCPLGGDFDLRASYAFDMGPVRATVSGNVTNLFNQYYIEKAWSANSVSAVVTENTIDNIYFFYNKGRQWNIRLKIAF